MKYLLAIAVGILVLTATADARTSSRRTGFYTNATVRFIRLEHSGPGWDDGMDKESGADVNFLRKFAKLTGAKVAKTGESHPIHLLKQYPRKLAPPFVYITGSDSLGKVGKHDIDALRSYLTGGGMLFADCGGAKWHGHFLQLTMRLFPETRLVRIADDDPIFRVPFNFSNGAPPLWHHGGYHVLGIKHDNRWAVIYHPGDVNDAWKTGHSGIDAGLAEKAFRFGINIVFYAWRHAPQPRKDFVLEEWRTTPSVPPKLKEWLGSLAVKYKAAALSDGTLSLVVNDGPKLVSLAPLADIPLRSLTLYRTPVSDLSPLSGMPLETLNIGTCGGITNLSPLKGMELKTLLLSGTGVADLSPLKGMPLRTLAVGASMKLTDLSALKGLSMDLLDLRDLPVTDLTPLRDVHMGTCRLTSLHKLVDLSPLKAVTLRSLSLRDLPKADMSSLAGVRVDLLSLSKMPAKAVTAAGQMEIKSLGLTEMPTESLAHLKGMNITDLSLSRMVLQDLAPLKGLPLKKLTLLQMRIRDVSALAGMQLEWVCVQPGRHVTGALEFLRNMKSLKHINYLPADDFWKKHDARPPTR